RNIYDCAGNEVQNKEPSVVFGLPEAPAIGDVLINEVLFNPRPGGVDFIELHNSSSKFFNLKDWRIANIDSGSIVNQHVLFDSDHLFAPNEFLVLTSDRETLVSDYPNCNERAVWETQMPRLNDDEGNVAVVDMRDSLIDFMS